MLTLASRLVSTMLTNANKGTYLVKNWKKHANVICLFCLFVQPTSPQRRRMPSIPYGLQDTSLFHCFGIFRVDKTSTGFSVESGYPSIESSMLITSQGKLVMTASRPVMLQSAVITAPVPPPAAVSSCLQPLNYYGHRHRGPAVRKEIMLLINCKALILLVFLYNPSDFVDISNCCKHPYEWKSSFRHFSDIQCTSTAHCVA